MKNILLSLLSVFLFQLAAAQDPVFNQFYNAPIHTNPALTGAFQGKWRAGINYRDAWSLPLDGDPYRTIGASMDMRFQAFNRDFFALGVNFINDQAGSSDFQISRAQLTAAYLMQLAGVYQGYDSYISLGVQGGFGSHSFSDGNLWFYQQYDAATNTIGTNTPTNSPSSSTDLYIDLNVGLLWYAVFDENKSIYAGGSYFHANAPEISFLNDGNITLDSRILFHGGGELPLSKSVSILPNFMYTAQAGYRQISPGMNLRFNSKYFRELALRAGIWLRFTNTYDSQYLESYIPSVMLEYEKWLFGLSYEINNSPITAINNGRGGIELSVYYYQRDANFRTPLKCPKF